MNKLFKFALAALPIVMLASCAKDDLDVEGAIAQESETRYLQVTLSNPSDSPVSRAWTEEDTNGTTEVVDTGYYADGTEAENRIRTLDFYFYDRGKQFHSYVSMTIENAPQTPTENPRPTASPNISSFYHCNVPITLEQGKTLPTYVVCIVNSVEGTAYQGSTMQGAQAKRLHDIYANEHSVVDTTNTDYPGPVNYFGMSNSVYYGTDPVTGNDGVLIMAAPFTTDKLLTKTQLDSLTLQASKPGTNQNEIEKFTINIPVERYAAKVYLDLSSLKNPANMPDYQAVQTGTVSTQAEGGAQANTAQTPIALKFTPMKWGVNATEKEFFFLKSFREPAVMDGNNPEGFTDNFATQSTLNNILFKGWNNEQHKRCYWARTPGYYADNYPLTSDDIKDNTTIEIVTDEKTGKVDTVEITPFDLIYKNWNQCAAVGDLNKDRAEYVKETTMKQTRLTGEGLADQYLPTASLPAVILLGQYQVGNAAVGTDFYLYGEVAGGTPVVYSSEDEPIDGTQDIKEKMFVDQTIVLTKRFENGKDVYSPVNTGSNLSTNDKAAFVVKHPDEAVRKFAANTEAITGGALHIAADVVALQLTKAPSEYYFYNPSKDNGTNKPAGGYEQITSENLTYVNLLLFQNLGGAHFYKDGMAYFSAPIQHWGWYRDGNVNRNLSWDKWSWKDMKTGDFGVVRNHVYTLNIGSITGLGTAISDPKDPIVPPADKVSYSVHFHVNIQRWAVLPEQSWNW